MTGIIILNKAQNMTSFSACNRVRRLLSVKKAGHSGTLDPMATGVLTVALSSATRFIPLLPSHDKSYTATAELGITTDTLDITGKVLIRSPVSITPEQIVKTAKKYKGEIMQIPPMYSAINKDGQKLYDLARQGIEVSREPRKATVYELDITECKENHFTLEVRCSSGTYIRTLIDDIGRELGCGAVMTSLKRTSANGFSLSQAHTLEEIEETVKNGTQNELIIPVESCFEDYEKVTVTPAQAVRFSNGGALSLDRLNGSFINKEYTVFSPEGKFLGLAEADTAENLMKIKRIFKDE